MTAAPQKRGLRQRHVLLAAIRCCLTRGRRGLMVVRQLLLWSSVCKAALVLCPLKFCNVQLQDQQTHRGVSAECGAIMQRAGEGLLRVYTLLLLLYRGERLRAPARRCTCLAQALKRDAKIKFFSKPQQGVAAGQQMITQLYPATGPNDVA